MRLSDLAAVACRQVVRTRRRYRAPLIGATLGIASLIIVCTLGDMIQKSIGSNLSLLGSATLIKLTLPLASLDYPDDPRRFTEKDLKDIERIPGVALASAAVYSWWPMQLDFDASYRGKEYLNVRIMGVDSDFFRLTAHMPIAQGRSISRSDTEKFRHVCVIGHDVKDWLFPKNVSPLGDQIVVEGIAFEVVGVLGIGDNYNLDETIILPVTVARSKVRGLNAIRRITVLPKDIYSVEEVFPRVEALLGTKNPKYRYSLYYDRERIKIIKNVMSIFRLFVYTAVIATLILSEIGLVNVMLSMVRERTFEIGLRKAVGATDLDITAQFIWESVIVGLVSSAVGILLATAVVFGVSEIALDSLIDIRKFTLAVIVAVVLGGLAGVASGVLPARMASRLDPAFAMRAE
jgi:putative ABC transport system permease protein